jgi:hypothetical protein
VTAPWDSEALWRKAKLFINYALDHDVPRTFDERALWATLALELLAKSALARASPLLIAVPTEDGKNLLAAAGLTQDEATFKSIAAATLFKRCARALKPFNGDEAARLADRRNGYLHAATPAIAPIPEAAWWPRFWPLIQVLVHACDREIEELVGSENVREVAAALAENSRNVQERFEMLVERARQRLARFEAGEMRAAELRDWERHQDLSASLPHSARSVCPACGSEDGLLEGDEILETATEAEQVSETDYDVWLRLEIGADYFSCERCRCVLDSYEFLEVSGIPTSLEAVGDPADFWEPEYGND